LFDIKINMAKSSDLPSLVAMRQASFAFSRTLNGALFEAKDKVQASMDKHIEGGATRFTKQGMKVNRSTKRNLKASLVFKQDRAYMEEIMHGGRKTAVRKKIPEPIKSNIRSKSELNVKGNIPRSLYKKARAAKGGGGGSYGRYFIGYPRGRPKSDSYYGIYRRVGKPGYRYMKNGKKKARGRIEMVVWLGRGSRQQRITFPAPDIARKEANIQIRKQFNKRFREALASARGFRRV
jgi:hypothetical protein